MRRLCLRGNLMMIILYATVMATVLVSILTLTASYNDSLRDSSRSYANYQTFETITEIATYGFAKELIATTWSSDDSTSWVSDVSSSAAYNEALRRMIDSLLVPLSTGGNCWYVDSVEEALNMAGVTDGEIVDDIQNLLRRGRFSIVIKPDDNVGLNWDDSESYHSRDDGHVRLDPLKVQVCFYARNDYIDRTYEIDGIYLNMSRISYARRTFSMGQSNSGSGLTIFCE